MNKKTVIITEKDGTYQIENNGISKFALIGILECFLFELKSTSRKEAVSDLIVEKADQPEKVEPPKESAPEVKREAVTEPNTPDLRTRITNAVKAIKGLGGETIEIDSNQLTEEELQLELEELTRQYKRLKSSQAVTAMKIDS